MFDFSRNPKEMFVVHKANWACYAFIYIMVYVLPMVLILASRFFWIKDEQQMAQYVKDMVDDTDQKDGFIFNRFYADCCHNGMPIPWEDLL